MSYSTGAFSGTDGFDVVQSKLATFAVAEGWTANANTYPNLQLSKGTCFVNLTFDTTALVDDTLNTGASVADYRVKAYLSDAYPVAGTEGTNKLAASPVITNDWVGPYSNYWLFSGGMGDPDYIAMVVQKSNGRFCCIMFGTLDKKGISYTGGEFITGTFWSWWFRYGSSVGYSGSGQGSDPYSTGHGFPGDYHASYNVHLGDANTAHPYTSHNAGAGGVPYAYGLGVNSLRNGGADATPTALEGFSSGNYKWHGHIYWLGPNPVNGVSPMFEIPYNYFDGYSTHRLIALGAIPNYRAISMIGRSEAEEVSFGADNWMVFPIKRYLPWTPEPFATRINTSGIYGHAFKINP